MKIVIIMITVALALGLGVRTANAYSPYCGNGDGCYQVSDVNTHSFLHIEDDAVMANDSPYDIIAENEVVNPIAGQNVYEDYSSLPERIQAPGERMFIFSPRKLRWAAYDADGYQVAAGKANGGSNFCAELGRPCHTPVGTFRVQAKGDVTCKSRRFPLGVGGAAMPYCMYFGSGFAIHGSPYISDNNTSHGCIRVHTPAAAWLSRYFLAPGTKVMVLPY
jgi:hypothetical protein